MIVSTELIGHTTEPAAICNPTEVANMLYEVDNETTIDKIKTFLSTMKTRMLDDAYTDIIERQNYSMGAVLDIIDVEFPVKHPNHMIEADRQISISFEF